LIAAYIGYRVLTGDLGANPITTITHLTGRAALILLLLTLATTPARAYLGVGAVSGARRPLGLYAFAFAVAHLLVFVAVDYGFDLDLIRADGLAGKPYILVGAAALAVMVPLALTSNKMSMRRLGRRWKRLHKLVYVSAVLAAVHYLWIGKVITPPATVAAFTVATLLGLRAMMAWRRRPRAAARAAAPNGRAA